MIALIFAIGYFLSKLGHGCVAVPLTQGQSSSKLPLSDLALSCGLRQKTGTTQPDAGKTGLGVVAHCNGQIAITSYAFTAARHTTISFNTSALLNSVLFVLPHDTATV